jgi:integrase/recombinase XerD
LSDLLASFIADQSLRNLAPSTMRNLQQSVSNYLQWAESQGHDPAHADLRLYLKLLRDKRDSQATIRIIFSRLAVFFSYLMRENVIEKNPVPQLQQTYLSDYKRPIKTRKALTIEQASEMVSLTTRTRDKAILMLLLKTGIRRNELISLDIDSLDMESMSLTLKETHKRSNRVVFFDGETARVLTRWIRMREKKAKGGEKALFLNLMGGRLDPVSINRIAKDAEARVNAAGQKIRFHPHIGRYCFTTWLLDANMPIRFLQWLRGDVIREAYAIYDTIRPEDVKRSYLACIPQLGI